MLKTDGAGRAFARPIGAVMSRVLIVDDDELLLELLRFKLESRGYDVVSAEDGEAALARVAAEPPDLIVLDMMMPGLDGLVVLQRLKQSQATSAIPVVMLTARKQQDDIVRALKLGAREYLVKPFMPEELLARMKIILQEHDEPAKRQSA